jgi:hypothetical protein
MTIAEAKQQREEAEQKIVAILKEFQQATGMTVAHVLIRYNETIGRTGRGVASVDIEAVL